MSSPRGTMKIKPGSPADPLCATQCACVTRGILLPSLRTRISAPRSGYTAISGQFAGARGRCS